jgi:micrococcal nuclease
VIECVDTRAEHDFSPHRSQADLALLIEGGRQTPATPPGCWSYLGAEQRYHPVLMPTAGPQRPRLLVVCFILLVPLFALVACGPIGSTLKEDTPRAGAGSLKNRGLVITVSRVVDGDTVEVIPEVDDLTEVRLIGVDTPETSHPTYGEQPYGQQAKEFTVSQLEGERVALEFDMEKVDQYGRLLAYLWLTDGRMFNEALLREGYAQMATFSPNVKYVERFREAQREAREANRGCGDFLSDSSASRRIEATA